MTTHTWTEQLVEQLDWHWTHQARPRLDGLTDDEYRWEPVPGSWNIRPRPGADPAAPGAGTVDVAFPEPTPPPITTIAWRMGHLAIGVFGNRAANHFGQPGTVEYETTDWPLTAAGGLALLDRHYAAWIDGVRSLDDQGLARRCGPAEGPYAEWPLSALVLHISREGIHHLAEIALLRDLYARRHELAAVGA